MGVMYVPQQQRPGARTVRVTHFGSYPVGVDKQVPPPPPAHSRVCHVGREGLSVEHFAPLLYFLCTPLGRCCGGGLGRQTSLVLRILLLVSFPLTRLPIRHSKRTWARQLPLVLRSTVHTCHIAACIYVAADCRGSPFVSSAVMLLDAPCALSCSAKFADIVVEWVLLSVSHYDIGGQ